MSVVYGKCALNCVCISLPRLCKLALARIPQGSPAVDTLARSVAGVKRHLMHATEYRYSMQAEAEDA